MLRDPQGSLSDKHKVKKNHSTCNKTQAIKNLMDPAQKILKNIKQSPGL